MEGDSGSGTAAMGNADLSTSSHVKSTHIKRMDSHRPSTIRLPSLLEVEDIATNFGLTMEEEELKQYQEELHRSLKMFDQLEEFVEPNLPVRYPRLPGNPPSDQDNQHNAWCWRCDIRGSETGILAGKTIAIKDNIPVAGVPLRNGGQILRGYTPDYDATVVARLLNAGGHIIGKATCENSCASLGSCMSTTGLVTNPHDVTKMAGGSSSGCAVLVSTGAVDMAVGCDQGGSIRVPASACGIVGLKPTWGLVPYTGILSMETTVDHVGPMTRTVRDCAILLQAMAGREDDGLDPRQPNDLVIPDYTKQLSQDLTGVKIGLLEEGFYTPRSEEDVDVLVTEAAFRLVKIGAVVERVSIPMHEVAGVIRSGFVTQGLLKPMTEGAGYLGSGYYPMSLIDAMQRACKSESDRFPVTVKKALLLGGYLERECGVRLYAKCQNLARELTKKYDQALKRYDVLIMPTVPHKPKPFPSKDASMHDLIEACQTSGGNTTAFNVTGHPALSINAGFSQGLPVGMMIVGKHFDDSMVIKVAYAYEQLGHSKNM